MLEITNRIKRVVAVNCKTNKATIYRSANAAAKKLGVPKAAVYNRINHVINKPCNVNNALYDFYFYDEVKERLKIKK